jgi:RNA polymerase sigma-B factor
VPGVAVTDPETLERFRELRRTGSTALRDALVEEHARFAEYLARRYARRGEPYEDLCQVALVGLVNAVERFDPEHGSSFTAFAAPTITGEIKRHFRDRTWLVKVPRHLQELSLEVERCRGELGHELGRSPTIDEIASRAGVDEEEVLLSMEAAGAYRLASLDEGSDEPPERASKHGLGAPDPRLVGTEDRLVVHEVLQQLPLRERRIVHLRYYEGLTQSEIAVRVGISQMHVSRLLSKSLDQMASALGAAS